MTEEVSFSLSWSMYAADKHVELARTVRDRLPAVHAALSATSWSRCGCWLTGVMSSAAAAPRR